MQINNKINQIRDLFKIIFLKEEKTKIVWVLFYMFCGMMLELFGVGLILPSIKVFTDGNFLNLVYNFLGISGVTKETFLLYVVLFFIFFFGFKNLILREVVKKQSSFLTQYEANLQFRLFKSYVRKPIIYFKDQNSSELVNNIVNISSFFSAIYLNAILFCILELFMCFGILILLFYFSWLPTLVIFFLFGGVSLILFTLNKKKLVEIGEIRNKLSAVQLQDVQDGIGGIKEIKLMGKESFFLNKFKKNTDKLAEVNFRNYVIANTPRLIIEFISVLSISLIIFVLIGTGKTIVDMLPILGLFFAASYKVVPSMNKILLMINRIKFSADTAKRIIPILRETHNFEKDVATFQLNNKINFLKNINLKNISYKYPHRENKVLKNTNLIIKKNSFVGISGESGVGKTTLLDIIMGILEPNEGEVLVDDVSLKNSIKDWQESIGYVSQNIFLIPDTIKKNIAFGVVEDQINEELVQQVVSKSALKNFIENLDENINTQVGEGGAMISGGQKQRIGIARALYVKPKLLILDEATSSLDLNAEKEILTEIQLLKKDTTLVFISHRESAINYCDEKYELKDGYLKKT
tara:strand:- start:1640 stop:3379 length:1740 start_codon:yes stop_codon:yes gene_type:complete